MCKSRAEGGQRCQAHTRQAVSDQMVAYAAAIAPVNRQQAQEIHRALLAEGEGMEDPSREEVDAWIESTMRQVRHEPGLTESRRERILRRLREALGRVTPSGAQFHAWKAVVAEAWARSRRRAAVFFAAGVISFAGGCGVGSTEPGPGSSPTTSQSQSVEEYQEFADQPIAKVEVPTEVAARFGEADAKAAYEFAAQTYLDEQMNPERMRTAAADLRDEDLLTVYAAMTPSGAQGLRTQVKCAADGDYTCRGNVAALVVADPFDVEQQRERGEKDIVSVRSGVPVESLVQDKKVTKPALSVDPDGRLKATFVNTGFVRSETQSGNFYRTPFENRAQVWLKKTDGEWKIDGWQGKWTAQDDAQPDS